MKLDYINKLQEHARIATQKFKRVELDLRKAVITNHWFQWRTTTEVSPGVPP